MESLHKSNLFVAVGAFKANKSHVSVRRLLTSLAKSSSLHRQDANAHETYLVSRCSFQTDYIVICTEIAKHMPADSATQQ